MRAPSVAVIIPAYDRASIVRRAIDSALAAGRPGDEVIVVDDGSTDNAARQLQEYGDLIRSRAEVFRSSWARAPARPREHLIIRLGQNTMCGGSHSDHPA